jgi:hypothetical protein
VRSLLKALYSFKQAAQAWNEKPKSSLSAVRLTISLADPCLYITTYDGKHACLLAHANDVLIVEHATGIVHVKKEFSKLFDVRDLGDANVFLCLRIMRARIKELWLGQSQYIEHNMQNSVSRVSTSDSNHQLSADGDVLA